MISPNYRHVALAIVPETHGKTLRRRRADKSGLPTSPNTSRCAQIKHTTTPITLKFQPALVVGSYPSPPSTSSRHKSSLRQNAIFSQWSSSFEARRDQRRTIRRSFHTHTHTACATVVVRRIAIRRKASRDSRRRWPLHDSVWIFLRELFPVPVVVVVADSQANR